MKEHALILEYEWILKNLSTSIYCNGDGRCQLSCPEELTGFALLNKVFESLNIPIDFGYYDLGDGDIENFIEFEIEKIKESCPDFYEELKEMNFNNSKAGKRLNKLKSMED